MAAQSSIQDRRPSPGLALNLNSNNPFRRGVSPAPPSYDTLSPQSPPLDSRRISTNPFLDTYRSDNMTESRNAATQRSPTKLNPSVFVKERPRQEPSENTASLMKDLTLSDRTASNSASERQIPHRGPPRIGAVSTATHQHTHSQDEPRRPQTGRAGNQAELDIFASPPREQGQSRRPRPRPRRNSESSMMDVKEDDLRRRERRMKEREQGSKDRDGRSRSKKSNRPARGLDIIDRLDVSNLYGPGSFHHDGPFDACNPHRNRKGSRAAPMQAFPVGSANNALGGSGPVHKGIDYDAYHGRHAQGYADYNVSTQPALNDNEYINFRRPNLNERSQSYTVKEAPAFSAKENIELVHGEPTAGLGTSTFMEGTPASRAALMRRESETAEENLQNGAGGGLSRKRSIAQKFRGMSRGRPNAQYDAGRVRSPEGQYQVTSPGPQSAGPPSTEPQSAGGRGGVVQELNPFFNEPPPQQQPPQPPTEKKGTAITIAPTAPANGASSSAGIQRARTRTNSSPHRNFALPRRSDDWGIPDRETKANGGTNGNVNGGGILGRVKSLRGKKSRPERVGTAP